VLAHYSAPAQSSAGALQPGTQVAVYQEGTTDGGTQAGTLIGGTVYADAAGATPLGNPFTTGNGEISFYLDAPLRVDLGMTLPGASEARFPDIDVLIPAQPVDADAGDIQPLGSAAAAGSVGLPADAGHVHPLAGITSLVASTGTGGYSLANGTGTILAWTAPSDGALHYVTVAAGLDVSASETGGAVTVSYPLPGGATAGAQPLLAGGASAGALTAASAGIVASGGTVTVSQSSALTAGAATLWAQVWGY
jgi:hypothetical protein